MSIPSRSSRMMSVTDSQQFSSDSPERMRPALPANDGFLTSLTTHSAVIQMAMPRAMRSVVHSTLSPVGSGPGQQIKRGDAMMGKLYYLLEWGKCEKPTKSDGSVFGLSADRLKWDSGLW